MKRTTSKAPVYCVKSSVRAAILALVAASLPACSGLRSLEQPWMPSVNEHQDGMLAPPSNAPGETFSEIAYVMSIIGVTDGPLLRLLENSSQLAALKDRGAQSVGAMRQRATGDVDRLSSALRSEGFYAAKVTYDIDRAADPIQITLNVSLGVPYVLAEYKVVYRGAPPVTLDAQPAVQDLGVEIGMQARAPTIAAAQRTLLGIMARHGHPFAKIVDRQVLVRHLSKTMSVLLEVDAGPFARFGPLIVEGADDAEADYVRSLLTWDEGAPYDQNKVESSRNALSATGLFAAIEIRSNPESMTNGGLPMTVELSAMPRRTIGFGASYSTSEGPGGEVHWEHRNLLSRNERLRLTMKVAEIEQVVSAEFGKPRFLQPYQSLLIKSTIANRNTDAFEEQSISASIGLTRPWRENWRLQAGLSGEYNIIAEDEDERTFQLIGLPLSATRDATDNLLNPSQGSRLNVSFAPYVGRDGSSILFAAVTVSGSAYYSLDGDGDFILAGRAKVGSLFGEETEQIPANKRFYAGGGGSIRGFAFQSVGPLEAQDDPLGGRSLLELKGELRVRLTESIGLVPFVDGGNVFDASYPDFQGSVRWAAGLGARYFTDFGPLRLDVAVPINKRAIDDNFQFYVSIGQAF